MKMTIILLYGFFTTALIVSQDSIAAELTPFEDVVLDVKTEGPKLMIKISQRNDQWLEIDGADTDTRGLATLIAKGDKIAGKMDEMDKPIIKKLEKLKKPASTGLLLLALGGGLFMLCSFAMWASRSKPLHFVVGMDNRYSNSKLQAVMWFGAVIIVYIGTLILRVNLFGWNYLGGVSIPENLLLLSGLSALTYGAAKAITEGKVSDGAAKPPAEQPNFPNDLFMNDDKVLDLGDSQMIFLALLAIGIFLLSAWNFLGWVEYAAIIDLPDVDTTLLSLFGLGQGAYLVKKTASPAGKG